MQIVFRTQALERALDRAGGVAKLAEALGITSQAISQWRQVPHERVLAVEKITGIPRYELRPDLYPRDTKEPAA